MVHFSYITFKIKQFEVTLREKNIAQTDKSAIGFGNIHRFCDMIIIFHGCSIPASNISRATCQKRLEGKKKHTDPIFLRQIFNVLYMAVNWAKFEKNLDSTSFLRELLQLKR